MLVQCQVTVYDTGPTINQHCLLGYTPLFTWLIYDVLLQLKHILCWCSVTIFYALNDFGINLDIISLNHDQPDVCHCGCA